MVEGCPMAKNLSLYVYSPHKGRVLPKTDSSDRVPPSIYFGIMMYKIVLI